MFSETQYIPSGIRWTGVGLVAVALGLCVYAVMEEVRANPDSLWQGMFLIGLLAAILLVLLLTHMTVRVDGEGIAYRYFPYSPFWKTIRWEEVQQLEAITYDVRKLYGAHGYRFSQKDKSRSVTVSGDRGMRVRLKNGDVYLFGTQNINAWKAAVKAHRK